MLVYNGHGFLCVSALSQGERGSLGPPGPPGIDGPKVRYSSLDRTLTLSHSEDI